MQFADRIRKLRQKYSKVQIADHLGVSPRTVEGYLAGRPPSPASARLLQMAEQKGIEVEEEGSEEGEVVYGT